MKLIIMLSSCDSSYSSLQKDDECMQRLNELDKQFIPSKEEVIYVTPTLSFQDSNRKT
jgi:hypothetical protein